MRPAADIDTYVPVSRIIFQRVIIRKTCADNFLWKLNITRSLDRLLIIALSNCMVELFCHMRIYETSFSDTLVRDIHSFRNGKRLCFQQLMQLKNQQLYLYIFGVTFFICIIGYLGHRTELVNVALKSTVQDHGSKSSDCKGLEMLSRTTLFSCADKLFWNNISSASDYFLSATRRERLNIDWTLCAHLYDTETLTQIRST